MAPRKETPAQLHARAFRARAGMQGALAACICSYPVVLEKTSTGHAELCPAHRTLTHYAERTPELATFYGGAGRWSTP